MVDFDKAVSKRDVPQKVERLASGAGDALKPQEITSINIPQNSTPSSFEIASALVFPFDNSQMGGLQIGTRKIR